MSEQDKLFSYMDTLNLKDAVTIRKQDDPSVDKEGTISSIITSCSGWPIDGVQMAVLTQLLRYAPIVELKEGATICRKAKDMRPKEAHYFVCVCRKTFPHFKALMDHWNNVCGGYRGKDSKV